MIQGSHRDEVGEQWVDGDLTNHSLLGHSKGFDCHSKQGRKSWLFGGVGWDI